MADILIKGMELPKDGCHHTLSIYADGSVEIGRKNNYKAIEVPTHGRLIDAEELKNLIVWAATCNNGLTLSYILKLIDDASTTVLEAST